MGEVPFLQNHYRVPHVELNEVDPEVGKCRRLPPEALTGHPMYPYTLGKEALYRLGSSVADGVTN